MFFAVMASRMPHRCGLVEKKTKSGTRLPDRGIEYLNIVRKRDHGECTGLPAATDDVPFSAGDSRGKTVSRCG